MTSGDGAVQAREAPEIFPFEVTEFADYHLHRGCRLLMSYQFSPKLTAAAFIASALVLTGCETGSPLTVKDPQIVAPPDKVSMILAQAADKSAAALETLAAVEQKRTPSASIAPIKDAPAELRRAITINWIGPANEISEMLAHRAGYKFEVLGSAPATPIVISLDVTNKPVIEALRSVGLQLGARADLHVDSERRVVELQYGSALGAGDMLTPMAGQ